MPVGAVQGPTSRTGAQVAQQAGQTASARMIQVSKRTVPTMAADTEELRGTVPHTSIAQGTTTGRYNAGEAERSEEAPAPPNYTCVIPFSNVC